MTSTTGRRLPAVLSVLLGTLLLATLLVGLTATATAALPEPAYVRLAHLSPETASVDVHVVAVGLGEGEGARSYVVPGVRYGALTDYRTLQAGSYVVSMRAAGAPADSSPVVSTIVEAVPGAAYTVAGVGRATELELAVLSDRLTMPATGRASVRVINAALSAPTVDIGPAGEPLWARGLEFTRPSEYVDVPVGQWLCDATTAGRATDRLPVSLAANAVYTMLLVDRGGGLSAELHTDGIGTSVVPVSGLSNGGGWLASPLLERPSPAATVGGALVAGMLSGAAVLRLRRRGRCTGA